MDAAAEPAVAEYFVELPNGSCSGQRPPTIMSSTPLIATISDVEQICEIEGQEKPQRGDESAQPKAGASGSISSDVLEMMPGDRHLRRWLIQVYSHFGYPEPPRQFDRVVSSHSAAKPYAFAQLQSAKEPRTRVGQAQRLTIL
jgi:hypothetical protein